MSLYSIRVKLASKNRNTILRIIFFIITLIVDLPNCIAEEFESQTNLAIDTLVKEVDAKKEEVKVVHVSKFNWPSSALGCPKPGVTYTQSIVPGNLVLLQYNHKQYRVHTGQGRALICKLSRMPLKFEDAILNRLKTMAKNDLAKTLRAEADSVKVLSHESVVWPDTNFACSTGKGDLQKKNVRGYLIKLEYNDRTFEYRTSKSEVMACPAINDM